MHKQPCPENRPWHQPVQRLTLNDCRAAIESWKKKHPALFSCELKGESAEKLPIYLLKITDHSTA